LDEISHKARYKIELDIRHVPGPLKLISGRIKVMEKSGETGNNEMPCFRCPRDVPKGMRKGCGGLINHRHTTTGYFSCPHCGLSGDVMYISEGAAYKATEKRVADLIQEYFNLVGGDADIYMKRYKASIKAIKEAGQDTTMRDTQREALMRQSKEEIEKVVYPFDRLMKDSLGGADMKKRFLAFLRA
tara:strand:+ start:1062 stop:1622 length:561 start_codon:yes stop_codon:yes gene_type:complete